MGMHHSSSGKLGYDVYDQAIKIPPNTLLPRDGKIFSVNLLKSILETENQMRLSKDWQAKFAEIDSNQHWKRVVESLQEAAIYKHWEQVYQEIHPLCVKDGDVMSCAVGCLRSARRWYDNQFNVGSLPRPIYIQHDRSRFGDWNIGDFVPDYLNPSDESSLLPLRGGNGFNSM
jgi:hypothetical protein